MVIEKPLAGPIGLFIKFSTLQEYGVDKVFFLENDNVDASQKNIIFLARGEQASQAIAVAGMYLVLCFNIEAIFGVVNIRHCLPLLCLASIQWDIKVDYVEIAILYLVSLDP